jgi:putative nucleotidyltransferase with HDIG domain
MIASPQPLGVPFGRRDLLRLLIAAVVLIAALTPILGADILPEDEIDLVVGDIPAADIKAPRAIDFISDVLTEQARDAARAEAEPQYDFTTEKGIAVASDQVAALQRLIVPVEVAFAPDKTPEERAALLAAALTGLSEDGHETLEGLTPERWTAVSVEAQRVLDSVERAELRDSQAAVTRRQLEGLMAGGLDERERMLAAELIRPLIVPNSSFDAQASAQEEDRLAAAVEPVRVQIRRDQTVVREGEPVTAAEVEVLDELGLTDSSPDIARLGGFLLLGALVVGTLLAWVWRFRRAFWYRTNVLVLLGLVLVFAALALRLTAGRLTLPYLLPTAAIGILIAVLLDGTTATVLVAILGVIAGAMNGGSLEISAYVFFGGLAGIVSVRRGDRIAAFVLAGLAIFLVNAVVVSTFSLLGERDLRGVVELWGASAASAGGAAVVAFGGFAVLGNVFGILTAFQLLELANPSQPLLRRLLVETPGTYHHSLMVGNLAERAAEAIGADPLLTRVAAYYHDVGKLANPAAFIENQAGGENVHDQLAPEESAQVLKQHVADGIDIAYRAHLPKSLIAFIPQHHGTAVMSYFYARARGLAAAPFGGPTTAEGRKAADAVDVGRFRHAGPKPQSREAALIMLADSVEASVRSLESRDEAAIRAMVSRIINERMEDGQFEECDLTMRDIERVKDAFVGQLLGMYHQRIAYPQNKVVELESRRAASGGGSSGRP